MADIKWSAFTSAGVATSSATLVGLQGGDNRSFTLSATPAASAVALWNANSNLVANNFLNGYATTATAAATTTLTVASAGQQYFTGSTTQTVVLPVTSTLALGQSFVIVNNSSGVVTVQSSGLNTLQAMAASSRLTATVISLSGTGTASWSWAYGILSITLPLSLTNGGTNAALTASNGGIFYSTASAGAILAGTATANQMLMSGASGAPSWTTSTYPTTNAINTLLYASSANVMAALATANSGVLITSSDGVPSISSTLPSGIAATNMSLTTPTIGAASATSVTFSSTTGIVGSTTNDAAAAGSVGQLISSVVADTTTSLTAGTAADVTSISLTAGDWDVWGNVAFQGNAATTLSQAQCWCSSTSATVPDITLRSQIFFNSTLPFSTAFPGVAFTTPTLRFSLSGTTTIYFSVRAGFAVSTLTAGGGIYARRRR